MGFWDGDSVLWGLAKGNICSKWTTSQEMKTFLFSMSYNIEPLTPDLNSRKIHFLERESNLVIADVLLQQ